MTARHLTASAAVIDPAISKVLLVFHNASQVWVLPGGHVDDGESPAEACLREVFEETGVRAVHVGRPLLLPGMWWQPSPFVTAAIEAPAKPERPGKPAESAHWHIDQLFLATADSALPLTVKADEVARAAWQPITELGALDVRAEVPTVLELAVELLRAAR